MKQMSVCFYVLHSSASIPLPLFGVPKKFAIPARDSLMTTPANLWVTPPAENTA